MESEEIEKQLKHLNDISAAFLKFMNNESKASQLEVALRMQKTKEENSKQKVLEDVISAIDIIFKRMDNIETKQELIMKAFESFQKLGGNENGTTLKIVE